MLFYDDQKLRYDQLTTYIPVEMSAILFTGGHLDNV